MKSECISHVKIIPISICGFNWGDRNCPDSTVSQHSTDSTVLYIAEQNAGLHYNNQLIPATNECDPT